MACNTIRTRISLGSLAEMGGLLDLATVVAILVCDKAPGLINDVSTTMARTSNEFLTHCGLVASKDLRQ